MIVMDLSTLSSNTCIFHSSYLASFLIFVNLHQGSSNYDLRATSCLLQVFIWPAATVVKIHWLAGSECSGLSIVISRLVHLLPAGHDHPPGPSIALLLCHLKGKEGHCWAHRNVRWVFAGAHRNVRWVFAGHMWI